MMACEIEKHVTELNLFAALEHLIICGLWSWHLMSTDHKEMGLELQ